MGKIRLKEGPPGIVAPEQISVLPDQLCHGDHACAYLNPYSFKNWKLIETIVGENGFTVSSKAGLEDKIIYAIEWPTQAEQIRDLRLFSLAIARITNTLDQNDDEYKTTIKKILSILKKSSVFDLLLNKVSKTHEVQLWDHVEAVAGLVVTDDLDVYDRLVLRIAAIFHDLGKAFDVGSDQLQLHALIASSLLKEALLDPKIKKIIQSNAKHHDEKEEDEGLVAKIADDEYEDFVFDTTEIVRLHHVLEKVDKGDFSMETLILILSDFSPSQFARFGRFVTADGLASALEVGKEKYMKYLAANIQIFLAYIEYVYGANCPEEQKILMTQVPNQVLDMLIEKIKAWESLTS